MVQFIIHYYKVSLMVHKEKILELSQKGYSYSQICSELGCSKGTVSYHLGEGQKQKNRSRLHKYRENDPIRRKMEFFKRVKSKPILSTPTVNNERLLHTKIYQFLGNNKDMIREFTLEELKHKLGNDTICYLTGTKIDLTQPRTYQFDHIIPKSRGGDNSLDNLGICIKQANQAKNNMTPDEFINLCKQVLEHQGYKISK